MEHLNNPYKFLWMRKPKNISASTPQKSIVQTQGYSQTNYTIGLVEVYAYENEPFFLANILHAALKLNPRKPKNVGKKHKLQFKKW